MAVIIGHASIDERGKANSGQAEDLAHHQRAYSRHGKPCCHRRAGFPRLSKLLERLKNTVSKEEE